MFERILLMLGLTPTDSAKNWKRKWSTWLSALQVAFAGALLSWGLLDERIKDSLPDFVPTVLGGGMLILGFLLPAAVNTVQKKLNPPPES